MLLGEQNQSDARVAPATLVELLGRRARLTPDRPAYVFLADGETEEAVTTYARLDQRARAIGAWLQSARASGERVLLLHPAGLEYVAAFFGCLYAGAVAVSAYPPRPNQKLSRLETIVADAQAKVALTTTPILRKLEALLAGAPALKGLKWLATDNFTAAGAEDWREQAAGPDTLAFLQYTSGSTAVPKGVMVSHGNLLHNERMIQGAFEHTEQSTVVGWLPLYHDMGLIGNMLQPLYVGALSVLMPPEAFLQRPVRWLQAISRYKARTSGAPNFAYDLCARKVTPEQRATLDLSSWDLAYNGAEPIRHETIERFTEIFEPCGFRRESFYPCYGLAEATLFVSGGLKARAPAVGSFHAAALEQNLVREASAGSEGSRTLVGCGRAWLGQQILIVDPETLTRSRPDRVGEIWVSGPSVTQGYWRQPEETKCAFRAYLSDTGEGPFLRTGDLGFIKGGELFVTGRLKDLIIIGGRNHYPQDIERTVEDAHPALRPGCVAAFSIDAADQEQLVVVAEVDHRCWPRRGQRPTASDSAAAQHTRLDVGAVIKAIRRAVSEQHELQVYDVSLIKPGSIPKTSSGKLRRRACRVSFQAGALESLDHE